jgi:hypothetical protein
MGKKVFPRGALWRTRQIDNQFKKVPAALMVATSGTCLSIWTKFSDCSGFPVAHSWQYLPPVQTSYTHHKPFIKKLESKVFLAFTE